MWYSRNVNNIINSAAIPPKAKTIGLHCLENHEIVKATVENGTVKLPEEPMVAISAEEWFSISNSLEKHHALFYQCWQMGRPFLTKAVQTAGVRFNKKGEYIEFLFNPEYWAHLTEYERLFVISHECLHVVLNHGVRTVSSEDKERTNKSLDIVVNHLLTRSFGFDRALIEDANDLCWTDTIFPGKLVPDNESFEYYYLRMPESLTSKICRILDDHSKLSEDMSDNEGKGWEKIIKKLDEQLTPEEKETIQKAVEKHFQNGEEGKEEGKENGGKRAGAGTGGWTFIKVPKFTRKRKWETVIKKWSLKYIRDDIEDKEQWARLHRRFNLLPSNLFLPSEMEDETQEKTKLPVFLFLDTSGSCYGYKDRFFQCGASLPKDRFNVRLFCFDTAVQETTLESGKIYGGGGTAFDIIEEHIQKLMKTEGIAYPEAVFLITDGMGSSVNPQHSLRWYWFLTPYNDKSYIPKESHVYELRDYE